MKDEIVPSNGPIEESTSVKYSKDCNIIPAGNGKMGHSEAVVLVDKTRMIEGEKTKSTILYTKDGKEIGSVVDQETGLIQFNPNYLEELKNSLGVKIYEELGLDLREIRIGDIIESSQFTELEIGKESGELTLDDVEFILKRHKPESFRDNELDVEFVREERTPEQKDKDQIAANLGIDPNEIDSVEEIRDRAASEILQKGFNNGCLWPVQVNMKDGSTIYANQIAGGQYEQLEGFTQGPTSQIEYTNYIDVNGRAQRAQVLSRTYNREHPDEAVSMIKKDNGEVVTVVEKMTNVEGPGIASISREMETDTNSSRHISGNVRDLVDEADPEKIKMMDEEMRNMRGEDPTRTINIKDMETVEEKYKLGLVTEEQLENSLPEDEEIDEDKVRTPGGEAYRRLYGI